MLRDLRFSHTSEGNFWQMIDTISQALKHPLIVSRVLDPYEPLLGLCFGLGFESVAAGAEEQLSRLRFLVICVSRS